MTSRRDDELPLSKVPPVHEDVRRELEFHIEQRTAELIRGGMDRSAATAAAHQAIGDRGPIETECRDIEASRRTARARADRLTELRQDLLLGWRLLRKSPGFTCSAILILALGIGANSAVFSIVSRALLRPLPYPDADRLVSVVETNGESSSPVTWANFLDIEKDNRSFEGMASWGTSMGTVLTGNGAVRLRQGSMSRNFFETLRVQPYKGRLPRPTDHEFGAAPVAMVSYGFWRDRLGAPQVLDSVRVRGNFDFSVIGVLPPDFAFGSGVQLWYPLELNRQTMSRTSHNWNVVARLRSGVTPGMAQQELSETIGRLRTLYLPDFSGTGARVTALQEVIYGSMRTPLYLLLSASGLLLLAASANLAGAQLARGASRTAEFAVRTALGAPRLRLVRQLLVEQGLLTALGCAAGLAVAQLLLRLFIALAPASLPLAGVHIDGWVLGFTGLIAIATTVMAGTLPALRLSDANTNLALRQGGRGTLGKSRLTVLNTLVAAEVALAVALLAGSSLLVRSFQALMDERPGFEPRAALAVSINLPAVNYPARSPRIPAFHDELIRRISSAPGVASVGVISTLPLSGSGPSGSLVVEGKPLDALGINANADYRVVAGDYFRAAGIPVVHGTTFRPDAANPPLSVIVDETFANREWPGESAIGRRLKVFGMDGAPTTEPWYTVVGVVGKVRTSAAGQYHATYYFDHHDRPPYRISSSTYIVRAKGADATSLAPRIREAIAAVDPNVAVDVQPFDGLVSRSVADRRFTMLILSTFSGAAFLLAIAGVYAVAANSVTQRRREMGIRLALGASAASVRWMVLRSALSAILPGLLAGAVLGAVGSGTLSTLLYGVSPLDLPSFLVAIALPGVMAVLSTAAPAQRATRVDPLVAMRAE